MSTPSLSRLQKAFLKNGIQLARTGDVIQVRNEAAQASILLPASLPLEEKAVSQLLNFASVHSPDSHHSVCKACATPDFHPGSIAPVGTIVATPQDFVIPAAIGTDINCGMRLLTLGLSKQQAEAQRARIMQALTHVLLQNGRNIPVHSKAFEALLTQNPHAFFAENRPLRLTMQAIETIVAAPGQHLGAFATAARMGQRLVNGGVRGALFAERWERALASGLITELHDARRQSAATVPAASGLGRAASRAVTSMRG